MRVLMVFEDTKTPRLYRYLPQIEALGKKVELDLLYHRGNQNLDNPYFNYRFIPMNPHPWDSIREFGKDNILLPYRNLLRKTVYRFIAYPLRYKRYCGYADKCLDILGKYDLIYCLSGFSLSQVFHIKLARKMGVPIVIRVRGNARKERSRKIKNRLYRWVQWVVDDWTLREYDRLIPISMNIKEDLTNRGYPFITEPLPNGVDTDFFKPGDWCPNQLTVGYGGRLTPEKGGDFLIKFIRDNPEHRFLIAGDNQGNYKIPDNTEYLGYIPFSEMPGFYNSINVLVLPSYTEGFSNTIMESYSSGTPIIATPQAIPPGLPLYGYQAPHNLDAWNKILRNLEPIDLKALGNQARNHIKHYSWDRYSDRLLEVFKEVLEDA